METTLIIGATGGIGSAVARELAGNSLLLSGRNETKLQQLGAELGAETKAADLGFESHVSRLFAGVDKIDTLIYAAGAAMPQPLLDSDPNKVREVWNANYFGLLWTLKHGLHTLSPEARVFVVGARPELVTVAGFSQYAAAKAAAARLLDVTRAELRRNKELKQVGFTLVLPPAVDTPLWEQVGRAPKGALPPETVAKAIAASRAQPAEAELYIEAE